MIKRYRVSYTVQFEAEVDVEVEPGQTLADAFQDGVSDIDIPEGGKNNSQYVENTFDIFDVETIDGVPVDSVTGEVLTSHPWNENEH